MPFNGVGAELDAGSLPLVVWVAFGVCLGDVLEGVAEEPKFANVLSGECRVGSLSGLGDVCVFLAAWLVDGGEWFASGWAVVGHLALGVKVLVGVVKEVEEVLGGSAPDTMCFVYVQDAYRRVEKVLVRLPYVVVELPGFGVVWFALFVSGFVVGVGGWYVESGGWDSGVVSVVELVDVGSC